MTMRMYAVISFILATMFSALVLFLSLIFILPTQVCIGSSFIVSFLVSMVLLCAANAGDDSNQQQELDNEDQ